MGDGHLNKCISCAKKDVRRRYYDPEVITRIVEYEKKRSQDPIRKQKTLEYQRKRRAKFPGKDKARQRVNNAVRDGRLPRKPCEVCGVAKVEAHHTDYRKPLDVKWLCRQHHLEAENKQHYQ